MIVFVFPLANVSVIVIVSSFLFPLSFFTEAFAMASITSVLSCSVLVDVTSLSGIELVSVAVVSVVVGISCCPFVAIMDRIRTEVAIRQTAISSSVVFLKALFRYVFSSQLK